MNQGSVVKQAVFVFVWRRGRGLWMRRAGTNFMNGFYGPPSGHVEEGESPRQAGVREVFEETALVIKPEDLCFSHVRFRRDAESGIRWINYFFDATKWEGEAIIAEPDKCDHLIWASHYALNFKIIPFVREVLDLVDQGIQYSEEL